VEVFTLSLPTQDAALQAERAIAHERIVDRIEEKDGLGAAEAMLFVIDAGYERVEAERGGRTTPKPILIANRQDSKAVGFDRDVDRGQG